VFCHIFYSVLQDCKDVNWKLFDNADLGLAPYGPTQSNLVHRSHFDTGYENLRQVTHLSARLMEKSRLAFK